MANYNEETVIEAFGECCYTCYKCGCDMYDETDPQADFWCHTKRNLDFFFARS